MQTQPSNLSNFAFINKSNGNQNNLIDLNSTENLKDTKFKEASDNIFKLFTQPQETTTPIVNNNVNVQNKGTPIYGNFPNTMYNQNNNYNGGYLYNSNNNNNYYSGGYQPQQQPKFNNNLVYSQSTPINNIVHSTDLFNKNSTISYETNNKMGSNFNMGNIDLTTLKVNNDKKDKDPFKSLVNFK